jgi:hypothetical protein
MDLIKRAKDRMNVSLNERKKEKPTKKKSKKNKKLGKNIIFTGIFLGGQKTKGSSFIGFDAVGKFK